MTSHIVLLIAYDGSEYFGWQKTKTGPSVEQELENALQQIFQQPVHLQAASRTDRGVHAEWQVVDFYVTKPSLNVRRIPIQLNSLLPLDIRCRSAILLNERSFHPTLDVLNKKYRYLITAAPIQMPLDRKTHWHVHQPLDRTLLIEAASLLKGTHDFRGLCNRRADLNETDTIRTVHSIEISEQNETITIFIEADHFLYKMARNIVGTMVSIARGKLPLSAIQEALSSRNRSLAGVTAPAHGLSLVHVSYHEPIK